MSQQTEKVTALIGAAIGQVLRLVFVVYLVKWIWL